MQNVIINCQPSQLDNIKHLGLNWSYSQQFGKDEIDVIVKDIDNDPDLDYLDPDEQLCVHYDINYDAVNCIELES